MNLKSDNTAPVHPEIMKAIMDANNGLANSYGHDKYSEELSSLLKQIFKRDVKYFLCTTGTAANCLCLASICPSYGVVFCAEEAHISTDECNAPSFFNPGVKLIGCSKSPSKIDLDAVQAHIDNALAQYPHASKPGCVTITNSTELGLVYTVDEVKRIGDFCKRNKIKFHMDGARISNAVAHLNCDISDLTWKAGVDVMSFGATKNGALMGELIIFFDDSLCKDFDYRIKQAGQLVSKCRYLSSQFYAYFKDNLWLKLAKNSNDMCKKLADGIKKVGKIELLYECEANEIFVRMKREFAETLWKQGAEFYEWDLKDNSYRFVTNWTTSAEDIERFLACVSKL